MWVVQTTMPVIKSVCGRYNLATYAAISRCTVCLVDSTSGRTDVGKPGCVALKLNLYRG